jgi:hypothetical protein
MSLQPLTDIENVRRHGGMTFDRYRLPVRPEAGYFVSIHSIIFAWHSLDDVWAELPQHYWPNEYYNDYLGFWQDPETGFWYVDFVLHTYSMEHALTLARERGEIAIYDLANGTDVRVDSI